MTPLPLLILMIGVLFVAVWLHSFEGGADG